MDKIITHEDWQEAPYLRFLALHHLRSGHGPLPPVDKVAGGINAVINAGRWLVECPLPGCGGAVVVSDKMPLFLCPYCSNGANGGAWYKVVFPKERAEIEALLLKRPLAHNRNWVPGETLKQLQAENKKRGIS